MVIFHDAIRDAGYACRSMQCLIMHDVTVHSLSRWDVISCLVALVNIDATAKTRKKHLLYFYYASAIGWGIKRYRDPSVCPSPRRTAAVGYRHAGCLQLSHVRTADPCVRACVRMRVNHAAAVSRAWRW